MTRLILVRHGRSTWNAAHRIQGHADPPLDGVGREQARCLAERLRGEEITMFYASPLLRARETADIIGEVLGVPVVPDERLKEHGVGDITGLTWEQIGEQYPDVAQCWAEDPENLRIPGAEESALFRARVVVAFDNIVARHADETAGVVTHGGTLGIFLNHLIGLPTSFSPFRFANASLSIVELHPVRPRILLLNDTCHLRGET